GGYSRSGPVRRARTKSPVRRLDPREGASARHSYQQSKRSSRRNGFVLSWLQVNSIPACQSCSRATSPEEDSIRMAKQNDEDSDPYPSWSLEPDKVLYFGRMRDDLVIFVKCRSASEK